MTRQTAHIKSQDGATLAVDTVGEGPVVILVGGAFNDRGTVAGVAAELAPRFTVVTYDRRGRGESTDPVREAGGGFDVQNEIDDLAAVIENVGGRAHLFGHSSGGILVLEAALRGLPVDSVAVYESPFRADPDLPHPPADFLNRITALADQGDRDGAASLFLGEAIGLPPEIVSGMKHGPVWDFFLDKALTLPYDVAFARPSELVDRDRLATLRLPVLAVYGDQTPPGLMAGAKVVADSVPGARLVVLPGQDHSVLQHPEALAPTLVDFFG
ncbi:alpha/beta fold hydrolase [Catenulispora pinisilvae]|uniref:alpha/beta fold hydrolase n=1 Tax=Catenulispora pinisilvae TaxID=2705253 RepID=UPI0018920B3B|nr:alpha/beta hydrolase [Catenulispora pinisilvae]